MTIEPNSFEYNLLYVLTVILIISKLLLSLYLAKRIIERKKEKDKFEIDFLFGIFILVVGLLIGRILYFYFDFYLTEYNPDKYYIYPNIIIWKIATFSGALSMVILLLIVDKKLLKLKLKFIPAIFLLITGSFQLLYPVNSAEDFQLISAVGMIGSLMIIVLPLIFLYIGSKTPGLQKYSFLFVLGAILFIIGSLILSEFIISPLEAIFGTGTRATIFLLSLVSKISGLALVTYSAVKFYA